MERGPVPLRMDRERTGSPPPCLCGGISRRPPASATCPWKTSEDAEAPVRAPPGMKSGNRGVPHPLARADGRIPRQTGTVDRGGGPSMKGSSEFGVKGLVHLVANRRRSLAVGIASGIGQS